MTGPVDPETTADDRDWYRRLVETAREITTVLDGDGTVTYASAAVERHLGYDPAALIGESFLKYVHPHDRDYLSASLSELGSDSKESHTVESRLRRADGSCCRLEATITDRRRDDVIGGFLVTGRPVADGDGRHRDRTTTRERMKLALEGANLGVWDWNMQTNEVTRDELLTEMLGYTPAEMGDHLHDWAELVHPDGKRRHDQALAEHVEEQTPYYECEYRLRTDAGDWKWVYTIGKVVEWADDGTPARAVGIHQDIDDRKRTELTLKEEREMFTDGPAVVFKWADAEGWPIEYVSANVETVFGYDPDSLRSEHVRFADIVHSADRERLAEEVAEQRSDPGDRIRPDPYRVITASGDLRWVLEHTKVLQKGSEDDHLLGYLVDITERKQRERQLAERERKYRTLFEDTRDALMVLDRDGYLDCNERTLELFGVESVESFLEYAPWDLAPARQPDGTDSKADALQYIDRAFSDGEAFFEWTHRRTDGTTFPAEVKLSRFHYEGERVLHALARDITARKEDERRIETQRDNLDVLNRVLRHDIRNDLQLVVAYAELIVEDGDEDTSVDHAKTILANAEHAVEITRSAREMADVMLSSDNKLKPISLRATLRNELADVRSAYPDADVTVESGVPDVSVLASDLLASVFRNLLKNAVQHNDKATPEVVVSTTTRERSVVVRIADNGPGVPAEQRGTIFGKGEMNLESSGTGIGLYLVETLVESYEGAVRVEDNDPQGAVFVVELQRVS